jgi:hypothetical protein
MLGEAPFLPAVPSPWGRVVGLLARVLERRIPPADLDERDPEYIRSSLPGLWLWASLYFRARVRGMHRVPAEGPVLLVRTRQLPGAERIAHRPPGVLDGEQ